MQCFLGENTTVKSVFNNIAYDIKGRLAEGKVVLQKILALYDEFTKLGLDENVRALFTTSTSRGGGFLSTLEANRDIILNHLKDPLIPHPSTGEMVHYFETSPGVFVMLRGTTRNESLHSKINRIWPLKCSQDLAVRLFDTRL